MTDAKTVHIHIVDDDRLVRDSASIVLEASGYSTTKYATAGEFLTHAPASDFGCLLLDIRMPGMDGIKLIQHLAQIRASFATLVMSGYADVQVAVQAVKAGAIDILEKPFSTQSLLQHVAKAADVALELKKSVQKLRYLSELVRGLSVRERQILDQVLAGLSTKEAARELRLSPRTVEFHRANIMRKMGVKRIPDLIRTSQALLTIRGQLGS